MCPVMKSAFLQLCVFLATLCAVTVVAERHCADVSDCAYCINGWYGQECDHPCPSNCERQSGCHRTFGNCDHNCAQKYWGRFCEHQCPVNCREGCNQTTGTCHGGCSPGWYSVFCNVSCSNDCAVCQQTDGGCVKFESDGGSHCKPIWTRHGRVKNCSAGCESGWRGARCNQSCPEECFSCSRYPGGQMCIYRREVLVVNTYRMFPDRDNEFDGLGKRVPFICLLVLIPFIVTGLLYFNRCGKAKADNSKRGTQVLEV